MLGISIKLAKVAYIVFNKYFCMKYVSFVRLKILVLYYYTYMIVTL